MSEWQNWLGRTNSATAWLDPAQANRMAATLDRAGAFCAGDALPPAWHWLYFHDIVRAADLGEDGHPALGVVMPPVPARRRMWAGGSMEFHAPLMLGETAERRTTVRSITPKQGRSGALWFVSVEHALQMGGRLALSEMQTIVYRDAASEAASSPPLAPARADYTARYALDSTALFRYSALTFNGHRIHYDQEYCREVEGYPNLVVHGPLIATLLLDLYVQQGALLRRFAYRARSPLCLPAALTVCGAAQEGGAALWARDDAGRLLMEAAASGW